MKILVVNDDGFLASGLLALAKSLSRYPHTFYFSAPKTHQSGVGMKMTYNRNLKVTPFKLGGLDYNAIYVDGSPVDALRMGFHHFNVDFDLVISGVNDGFNLGLDTHYSGTVSAVKEGILHGVRGIALSTEAISKLDNDVLDEVIDKVFNEYLNSDFNILNINIPGVRKELIKGYKKVDLANFFTKTTYKLVSKNEYEPYIDTNYEYNITDGDYFWYLKNYITVTNINYWDSLNKVIKE